MNDAQASWYLVLWDFQIVGHGFQPVKVGMCTGCTGCTGSWVQQTPRLAIAEVARAARAARVQQTTRLAPIAEV